MNAPGRRGAPRPPADIEAEIAAAEQAGIPTTRFEVSA